MKAIALTVLLMLSGIVYADTNTITGTTTIDKQKSPPPSAISPSIVINQNDICRYGLSGAVSTQILGISTGVSIEDFNCERIKLSRMLYQQGLKVASVSVLCEDKRVFKAMANAGTWCPYQGKIGEEARLLWEENPKDRPDYEDIKQDDKKLFKWGFLTSALGFIILF
jgi:hypothetical protein